MAIIYDPAKRSLTLADDRTDYGETRITTFGFLDGRMVVIVWTARGEHRQIIDTKGKQT